MSSSRKRRVWRLVSTKAEGGTGQGLESAALVLASLNVLAVILQSIDAVYGRFELLFDAFAFVSVGLFTILFVVRLWAAATTREYRGSEGRLRFVRRPFVLLDLLVIVVFWPTFIWLPETLGGIRVLWLARIFDLPRFRRSRTRFKRIIAAQREDLAIAFSGAGMLVLISSTLMYFAERRAQPEAFASIPDALWWGIVTLTTVGYGDVVPITPLGRILGAITTFGGIAFFALPSSILAAGFFAEREREVDEQEVPDGVEVTDGVGTEPTKPTGENSQQSCPHCGGALDSTETETR
ncbi:MULTISPECIES: potassium channel family protein [Haloferax]|uniref:Ion transporter n=1 Tax=Haloferax marinum TaxID=2666143 RepID=A0A6A8G4I3_9EURY|nr:MULTISPECIES: potassium channel family protein [Haloferax]KAB1196623.1 potassium channel family protein [Haloferax sp. CBA1150]MRW95627.1 ion transporter [Haloferax marinum]